ncbi:metallophosphoesterase [Thioalkalivibrio thiocyanodenitrificans]|uniref:metallophosphoesterase n=1 Tax=Thioalkalivibrio thiocyanodenitrificans TaxID=243063 RepID=UPI000365F4EB|nr:metallophosphoesterase [Thioalkalivibrio thiocyanodenitrificans]
MASNPILRLERNPSGRDFVVGDIHGQFHLLDKLMSIARFDPSRDRILCVGDLVDRGRDSERCLEFLREPWFFSVRGNHEQAIITAWESMDDLQCLLWVSRMGGAWWTTMGRARQCEFADAFSCLPIIIEVPFDQGTAGIVHAEPVCGQDWAHSRAMAHELARGATHWHCPLLWGRSRIQSHRALPVEGVTLVYTGHTICDAPRRSANVVHLDTGAFLEGQRRANRNYRLTMAELGVGMPGVTHGFIKDEGVELLIRRLPG